MQRIVFAFTLFAISASNLEAVEFSGDRESPPVRHAISEIEAALNPREDDFEAKFALSVGGFGVAEAPESLVVRQVGESAWQVAGADEIGLAYALLEMAESIRLTPAAADWRKQIREAAESPFLRTRSIQIQLFNEELERDWYFSEVFWHSYFGMLARNRFNQFTLTFGHQTNYLNPVYPWLFEVPEYENVRVIGLSEEQQAENLRMLARIAEIAGEHGLNFVLGIWTQQPVEKYGRAYLENFPEGAAARDFCARGLTKLLVECPEVDGVQFRMNIEAGINEETQNEYFQAQFDAIRACGRDVKLDIRYKGLRQETIDQAIESGLDVTVSTKFWCEHMGPPFHPTTQDRLYRESRYGYGTLLAKPRKHRVVYRMWTVGTQRLFVWGDPDYARRFASSCQLGGGEGFEIFEPLSNKGFDNETGAWRIFANPADEYFRWEFERYWFFHLVFGRLGYNPETPPEVWKREFVGRFGNDAEDVEQAYRTASQILPLLTATKLYGASEWRFWPEMATGGPLESYIHIQPSDYGQFYAIEPWKESPSWLAEPWAADHRGYVEDLLADRVEAKWSPLQVATLLDRLAQEARLHIDKGNHENSEFRAALNDIEILRGLARFHALKTLAAVEVAIFHRTNETGRLVRALNLMRRAAAQWEKLAEVGSRAYHKDLVFGYDAERAPPIAGAIRAHTGTWEDRIPEVRADVAWIQQLLDNANDVNPLRNYPALSISKPEIDHSPLRQSSVSADLEIRAKVDSKTELRGVFLYHRPLDQTQDWQTIRMEHQPNGEFLAVIPASALTTKFDHLYRLEARVKGGGTLWPDWTKETPYIAVQIVDD